MSERKLLSNRTNARKSTGPKSAAGKQKVSQNAKRHGILSTHLVLGNERREEFDLLLNTLQQEMEPAGLIEHTLVERIAVAMWRQRRLVRAESSELELRQRSLHGKDLVAIANSIGILPGDKRLKDAANFPTVQRTDGYLERSGNILVKMVELQRSGLCSSLDQIRLHAPEVLEELINLVGFDRKDLERQLEKLSVDAQDPATVVPSYLEAVMIEFRKIYDNERIKDLVRLYRDSVQVRASVDVIGRYQTTLDNELYKAMRALRDAQNWRLSRIDVVAKHLDEDQGTSA